jgi:hypothetical protein
MTDIKSLRDKADRAERLARTVGDSLTIDRLTSLSAEYRQRADQLSIPSETTTCVTKLCAMSMPRSFSQIASFPNKPQKHRHLTRDDGTRPIRQLTMSGNPVPPLTNL